MPDVYTGYLSYLYRRPVYRSTIARVLHLSYSAPCFFSGEPLRSRSWGQVGLPYVIARFIDHEIMSPLLCESMQGARDQKLVYARLKTQVLVH